MFVKITTSGPRRYVKLVEAYRDTGGVSRQQVIATLGRIEAVRAGEADSLVNGLLRAAGKPRAALAALNQYLNEAGNSGANYTAAIQMLRPLQEEAK